MVLSSYCSSIPGSHGIRRSCWATECFQGVVVPTACPSVVSWVNTAREGHACANPFDHEEIELRGTFESPSGRVVRLHGFHDGDGRGGQLGGNRENTRPFWANKKVPKEPRGVNRANQQSQNEGVSACEEGHTGPYAKDVAKDRDTWWRVRWGRGKGGLSAQELNRNTSGLGGNQAV